MKVDSSFYLFILPGNNAVYNPSTDDEPVFKNRKVDISLRDLTDQNWVIDDKSGSMLHTVWWGHFIFGLMEMDTSRKIIAEREVEEEGLPGARRPCSQDNYGLHSQNTRCCSARSSSQSTT